MAKNKEIHGIEILDSRGNHTVAASVVLDSGTSGCAAAPSGAATGSREAVELRDKAARATQAVANINGELREALLGRDAAEQAGIDRLMVERDGTPNKSRPGANAILAVSLALAKAAAHEAGRPLYRYPE